MSILTPHSKSGIVNRFDKSQCMPVKNRKPAEEKPIAYTRTGKPLTAKYIKRLLQYKEATEILLKRS